jgi:tetratricopeptide (TPR) repeat protein
LPGFLEVFLLLQVETMTSKTISFDSLLLPAVLVMAMAAPLYAADAEPEMLADQQRLEARISELEALNGAYGDELSEAYLGLGNNLLGQQQYEEAIAVFDNALQLARIRDGLNSIRQLPVLVALIDASLDINDWQTTNDYVHLYWQIAKHNFPPGRNERIVALKQLSIWQEQAASEKLLDIMLSDLRNSAMLYQAEINALTASGDQASYTRQLADLQLGYASLQYQLANMTIQRPLEDYQDGMRRTVEQEQCRIIFLPNGRTTSVCSMVQVPNIEYYVGQSARRDREIFSYLGNMEQAVQEAYVLMQQIGDPVEEDLDMLVRIRELTEQHNGFIEKNGM